MKTAFIFPAFISEYLGNEIQLLESFSGNLPHLLQIASDITEDDYNNISIDDVLYTEDELRSQVITYIFSCCLSDVLIRKGIKPDLMAGYSMGLYAALYTGKAISFDEGIKLIKEAFLISRSVIGKINSAMGSIIGLTFKEIDAIIQENELQVEIANTNSVHSHLVTGPKEEVDTLLTKAQEIGALNISLLKVSTPYHSELLKPTKENFQNYIQNKIDLKSNQFPIVSSINQAVVNTADQISNELVKNLFTRINWMETFNRMFALGIKQFIECGAGKSLYKIGRFIPGEFTIYPMNKVSKLF